MIRSMTAFARSETRADGWTVTWEGRSVNHRYLDISLRLPEALRSLESGLREKISSSLSRGKVECNLKVQSAADRQTEISLNRPLVERLLDIARELEQMMEPGMGLRSSDILCWPGVVSAVEPALEQLQEAVFGALEQTLVELVKMREREGERIAEVLRQRCRAMGEQLDQLRIRRPEVVVRLREKLLNRLSELPVEPDINRLEQEMVIVAQRLDVDEELDRLAAHLAEINDVLERPEPVGRRLDFLMQELNREANTLSAKSGDAETTRTAVELKVLIEQMREQVQNIE